MKKVEKGESIYRLNTLYKFEHFCWHLCWFPKVYFGLVDRRLCFCRLRVSVRGLWTKNGCCEFYHCAIVKVVSCVDVLNKRSEMGRFRVCV